MSDVKYKDICITLNSVGDIITTKEFEEADFIGYSPAGFLTLGIGSRNFNYPLTDIVEYSMEEVEDKQTTLELVQ